MFKERSWQKELLDAEEIPAEDLFLNLHELHLINKKLGGYSVSLNALKKIMTTEKKYHLVDIGCGGGDTLREIDRWAKKNSRNVELAGVDLKETCISYCLQNSGEKDTIRFICDDYRNVLQHVQKIDILHAALFCHHLNETEIKELVNFARINKIILVINDLERNPVAYNAIKFLTKVFSKSYLVKNDAPLSVLRGFKKSEWISILESAGAKKYTVSNKWAFRHEVIVYE